MKMLSVWPLAAMILFAAVGCQEGNTRAEVVGNGQGGVEVHRVAKDPAPPPQTSPSSLQRANIDDLQSHLRQQQAEIESLQAALRARDAEILRLKRSPLTQPTTGQ